jgi:3-oxoacyl-[acyl-carrier protein] reductase
MLLDGKTAVIYGGGGAIGGAVARAFGREGARVFLAGRTLAKLDAVADDIRAAGGAAETAEVDALDAASVDAHADAVAAEAGSLDISFNLISHGVVQGTPMVEMELDDYVQPVATAVSTTFVTARAAACHMVSGQGGVILIFGGSGPPLRGYSLAFEALESMRRQLSSELGRDGVRVVTLRTGGVPETIPDPDGSMRETIADIEDTTMLGRAATLEDVGNAAALAASDRARTMTAATINVSCGALID